ncbi:mutarotase [Hymenobacter sp. UV11]|uniref:2'-5' RNA ligase family protein n=1 Tax=Hymenobacter sp. UV11 TaxID=1849735 RepID=UPI00105E40AE|nr:mutarotase [Hymenobacter sp. UV11]TDN39467.1 hypothetical protein A8B98_19720 [Hymenobacter sp. UV11]TFZ65440.1 mutarotase [Hymenobacter sp. UV11]
MPLQATYDALRQAALPRLGRGEAELDPLIDSPQDTRRGITLLARPSAPITAALAEMMAEFQLTEPAQYYYPPTDIHLTILSIISCYPDFKLHEINPASYRCALRQIIQFIPPFRLTYQGLTASASGILAQGFPQGKELEELRTDIRNLFQDSDLQQSIDKRYSIQTAHSTIIRFKTPLQNPAKLLANLKKYERHFFGTFEVNKLELVYNDWYQRARNTVVLDEYLLSR